MSSLSRSRAVLFIFSTALAFGLWSIAKGEEMHSLAQTSSDTLTTGSIPQSKSSFSWRETIESQKREAPKQVSSDQNIAPSSPPKSVAPLAAVISNEPLPKEVVIELPPAAEPLKMQSAQALPLSYIQAELRSKLGVWDVEGTEREPSKAAMIAAFYMERSFEPLWLSPHGLSLKARALSDTINAIETSGLEPLTYAFSTDALTQSPLDPKTLADLEMSITLQALKLAEHLQIGRLKPARVDKLITPELSAPNPLHVLRTLSDAKSISAAVESFEPPHEGYKKLKAELMRRKDTAYQSTDTLTDGGIRAQKALRTVSRSMIVANMERWRWLPRELGERHIFVNIPAFELKVVQSGSIEHRTRVVVGKPITPTPVFSDAMEHVIVNPYWHVPPSISRKEYLPKLQQDPHYLARQGIEIIGPRGKAVDPASINWSEGLRGYGFRQPPGERNALGHIKFMFPNDHAVYLHDTPSRSLFARDVRAFSHGCVRVENPFQLAEVLLQAQTGWSEQRIRSMVGRGERMVVLEDKIPVHITYFTLSFNESGELIQKRDIYNYDQKMVSLLRENETAQKTALEQKPAESVASSN
jgi:L,D-transpeptidase YcbB